MKINISGGRTRPRETNFLKYFLLCTPSSLHFLPFSDSLPLVARFVQPWYFITCHNPGSFTFSSDLCASCSSAPEPGPEL